MISSTIYQKNRFQFYRSYLNNISVNKQGAFYELEMWCGAQFNHRRL